MTTIKVCCTEDAVKFIDAIKAECQSRGFSWWSQLVLDDFPSVEAREAANRALNRSIRLDQALERNLEAALATHGGVRLDMNMADETPAREGTRLFAKGTRLFARHL
jgi:hypothetical protein